MESLQPLSRQHKSALMACLLIRKGISKQAKVEDMVSFLQQCWIQEILPHFEQEEALLIPLLKKYPKGKIYADTILRDHELFRIGMIHLQQDHLQERLLQDLAEQLEHHIRFEERIVFQEMQNFIPPAELEQLILKEHDQPSICNNYPQRFWE